MHGSNRVKDSCIQSKRAQICNRKVQHWGVVHTCISAQQLVYVPDILVRRFGNEKLFKKTVDIDWTPSVSSLVLYNLRGKTELSSFNY